MPQHQPRAKPGCDLYVSLFFTQVRDRVNGVTLHP
jgi:hypothetical protein